MRILLYALTLLTAGVFQTTAQQGPLLLPKPRPNIVMVVADDMRYDSFTPTGGPEWFETPYITKLATEGVNFTNSFSVYSLCVPSRSTIFTGLYPHSHGAYDNLSKYFPDVPTVAAILDTAGYHTGFIGKYHVWSKPQAGYDYWFVIKGETSYMNPTFNYGNQEKMIPGHVTDIINDSAYQWLSTVDTPFFLTIGHQAPHKPVDPQEIYDSIYVNEEMPFPLSFYTFPVPYPTFLYERPTYEDEDSLRLMRDLRTYFEGIQGIEENVKEIYEVLQDRGLLNKTLIVFTSDNGAMYGEHRLSGKALPYEPSIRIPLFMRYPKWFDEGTVVSDQMALNVDFAPTFLEAGGVDATPYGFHGISLRALGNNQAFRDKFMYENIKLDNSAKDDTTITPTIRCLRTFEYKYVRYSCIGETEEFFDLVNDSLEDHNLIYDPAYAGLIDEYREMLDSMRVVLFDTLSIDTFIKACAMVRGPKPPPVTHKFKIKPIDFRVSPNPFTDEISIHMMGVAESPYTLTLYNELGVKMFEQTLDANSENYSLIYNGSRLPGGIYLLSMRQGKYQTTEILRKE